jgi:hypothetical protein
MQNSSSMRASSKNLAKPELIIDYTTHAFGMYHRFEDIHPDFRYLTGSASQQRTHLLQKTASHCRETRHTQTHTYIHTYIHTHIHTHIHSSPMHTWNSAQPIGTACLLLTQAQEHEAAASPPSKHSWFVVQSVLSAFGLHNIIFLVSPLCFGSRVQLSHHKFYDILLSCSKQTLACKQTNSDNCSVLDTSKRMRKHAKPGVRASTCMPSMCACTCIK